MKPRLRRWVGWMLHALLVLLFSMAYTAWYVHPKVFWWSEFVAPGLAFLTVVLIIAMLVAVVRRRRRWTVVYGILLVLAGIRFWPGPSAGPADPGETLTVLTYNIPAGRSEQQQGRDLLAFVRDQQPDLLILQEAYLYYRERPGIHASRYLQPLLDSLGYRTLLPMARQREYTKQAVLARAGVELLSLKQRLLPVRPDDPNPTELVRLHFRWLGREAVVYNVHLRSFGRMKPWEDQRHWLELWYWRTFLGRYRQAFKIRAQEAEQLRAMIEAETLPVIVAGDFNSTPHNWTHHHIAQGLQDAFRVAGEGWGGTYHTRLPIVHIDHVLVSEAWAVEAATIPDIHLSDHRPLVVRLRWAAE